MQSEVAAQQPVLQELQQSAFIGALRGSVRHDIGDGRGEQRSLDYAIDLGECSSPPMVLARSLSSSESLLQQIYALDRLQLKVFVGSSGEDDECLERSILLDEIYPLIRDLGRSRGIDVTLIDFISGGKDVFDYRTDRMLWVHCLKELKRCGIESSGLFFLSLQGENNYGHFPLPLLISEIEFNRRSKTWSNETKALMDKWYLLDNNHVNPRYVLQPISCFSSRNSDYNNIGSGNCNINRNEGIKSTIKSTTYTEKEIKTDKNFLKSASETSLPQTTSSTCTYPMLVASEDSARSLTQLLDLKSHYISAVVPVLLDALKDLPAIERGSGFGLGSMDNSWGSQDIIVNRSLGEWEAMYATYSNQALSRCLWVKRSVKRRSLEDFSPEEELNNYISVNSGNSSNTNSSSGSSSCNNSSSSNNINYDNGDIGGDFDGVRRNQSINLKLQNHLAYLTSRLSSIECRRSSSSRKTSHSAAVEDLPSIISMKNSLSSASYRNAKDPARIAYLGEFKEILLSRFKFELDVISEPSSSVQTSMKALLFPSNDGIIANFYKSDILKRILLHNELLNSFNRVCIGRKEILETAISDLYNPKTRSFDAAYGSGSSEAGIIIDLLIYGDSKSGKTTIASRLAYVLSQVEGPVNEVYINNQMIANRQNGSSISPVKQPNQSKEDSFSPLDPNSHPYLAGGGSNLTDYSKSPVKVEPGFKEQLNSPNPIENYGILKRKILMEKLQKSKEILSQDSDSVIDESKSSNSSGFSGNVGGPDGKINSKNKKNGLFPEGTADIGESSESFSQTSISTKNKVVSRPVIMRFGFKSLRIGNFCDSYLASSYVSQMYLVEGLIHQISLIYGLSSDCLPSKFRDLVSYLHNLLSTYPLIIIIDDADNFYPSDSEGKRADSVLSIFRGFALMHPDSRLIVCVTSKECSEEISLKKLREEVLWGSNTSILACINLNAMPSEQTDDGGKNQKVHTNTSTTASNNYAANNNNRNNAADTTNFTTSLSYPSEATIVSATRDVDNVDFPRLSTSESKKYEESKVIEDAEATTPQKGDKSPEKPNFEDFPENNNNLFKKKQVVEERPTTNISAYDTDAGKVKVTSDSDNPTTSTTSDKFPVIIDYFIVTKSLVAELLSFNYRTLNNIQLNRVIDCVTQQSNINNMLYLSLAVRVASTWVSSKLQTHITPHISTPLISTPPSDGSVDHLDNCDVLGGGEGGTSFACSLAPTLDGLVSQIVNEMEKSLGKVLVHQCIGFLTFSLSGLSDNEMQDLLSINDTLVKHVFRYSSTQKGRGRVPIHLWLRVKASIEDLLFYNRSTGKYSWIHVSLKDAVAKRFSKSEIKSIHCNLGLYFGNLVEELVKRKRNITSQPLILNESLVWFHNPRINMGKVLDGPFHLIEGGMFSESVREICNLDYICAAVKTRHTNTVLLMLSRVISKMTGSSSSSNSNGNTSNFIRSQKFTEQDLVTARQFYSWLSTEVDHLSINPSSMIIATARSIGDLGHHVDLLMKALDERCQNHFDMEHGLCDHLENTGTNRSSISSSNVLNSKPFKLLPVCQWSSSCCYRPHAIASHSDWVNQVALSMDSRHMASCSNDNTVKLWREVDGKYEHLFTLVGHSEYVKSVCFDLAAEIVISSSWDKTIRVWNTSTGVLIRTLEGHSDLVLSLDIYNDFKDILLVSCSVDKSIKLWKTAFETPMFSLLGHSGSVNCVKFSSDGSRIVSCSDDRSIKIWNLSSRSEIISLIDYPLEIKTVSFNPDGSRVAFTSLDSCVCIWDGTLSPIRREITKRRGAMVEKNNFLIYNLRGLTGKDDTSQLTFSTDGTRLLSGSKYAYTDTSGQSKVWAAISGSLICSMPSPGHKVKVECCVFNNDGLRLIAGYLDGSVRIFDAMTGSFVCSMHGHSSAVLHIEVCAMGCKIATASKDMTINVWDAICEK